MSNSTSPIGRHALAWVWPRGDGRWNARIEGDSDHMIETADAASAQGAIREIADQRMRDTFGTLRTTSITWVFRAPDQKVAASFATLAG